MVQQSQHFRQWTLRFCISCYVSTCMRTLVYMHEHVGNFKVLHRGNRTRLRFSKTFHVSSQSMRRSFQNWRTEEAFVQALRHTTTWMEENLHGHTLVMWFLSAAVVSNTNDSARKLWDAFCHIVYMCIGGMSRNTAMRWLNVGKKEECRTIWVLKIPKISFTNASRWRN